MHLGGREGPRGAGGWQSQSEYRTKDSEEEKEALMSVRACAVANRIGRAQAAATVRRRVGSIQPSDRFRYMQRQPRPRPHRQQRPTARLRVSLAHHKIPKAGGATRTLLSAGSCTTLGKTAGWIRGKGGREPVVRRGWSGSSKPHRLKSSA